MAKRILFFATVLILLLLPPLYNCPSYMGDDWRFWLLDPGTVAMRSLLPFTYTPYDRYYDDLSNAWREADGDEGNASEQAPVTKEVLSLWQKQNIREWRDALGGKPSEEDVDDLLYNTPPEDFFKGKYGKNSMMTALKRPEYQEMKQYMDFAKQCEAQLNPGDAWASAYDSDSTQITPLLTKADAFIANAKSEFVRWRAAYQRIKLAGYYGQRGVSSEALYEKHLQPAQGRTWLSDAAVFHVARAQEDSLKANLWFARAWNRDPDHRQLCEMAFTCRNAEATYALAKSPEEQAAIGTICGLIWPGPGLRHIEAVYNTQPHYPELSMLLAREVNKLEDWLMTERLTTFGATHAELPYDSAYDQKLQLQKDIAHLHACRQFVGKALAENKRPDPAFWFLSAAHLAFLDQDFKAASAFAAQGLAAPKVTPAQQFQLQLMEVLAEAGGSPVINDALESKMTGILDAFSRPQPDLQERGVLYSQIVRLFSDLLVQKGALAKGALLSCNSFLVDDVYGAYAVKDGYDKLLDKGTPRDVEEAVRLLGNPRTPLERWIVQHPNDYHAFKTWDNKTGVMQTTDPKERPRWDVARLYDLQSMMYMRRDQLDSALHVFKNVPQQLLEGKSTYWDDTSGYFYRNPFSIELTLKDVPLSDLNRKPHFNKKTFVEQLLALHKEAQSNAETRQLNYFLLANAYYNMAAPGRNWFLMVRPYKGYYESSTDLHGQWSIPEQETARWSALSSPPSPLHPTPRSLWGWVVPMTGLLLLLPFTRRRTLWSFLLGGVWILAAPACPKTPPPAAASTAVRPVDDGSKVWFDAARAAFYYEKALAIQPKSDLGVLCVYQLGRLKEQAEMVVFQQQPNYWEKQFVAGPNPWRSQIAGYTYQAPVECPMLQEFLQKK